MVDTEKVADFIREAAAAHIIPRFNNLAAGDIHEKKPGDLVTIADLETERTLTPQLQALMPGSVIVGEEAVAADPNVLALVGGDEAVWLIDPVDGTANFVAGMPLFAVMIALVQTDEIVASWIYDPINDLMASAERGAGAWANGKRLSVAPPAQPEQMTGSLSTRFGNRQLVRKIAGRSNLVGPVFSFRCAGHEYLALASGKAHFALYHRLFPWDHAPGVLLHGEAGGYGRRLDGSRYSTRVHDGGLLLTPDEESWRALQSVLMG